MRETSIPLAALEPLQGEGGVSEPKFPVARRAVPPSVGAAVRGDESQDDLRLGRAVEARLTEVVLGLRREFGIGCAGFWGDIHPIGELPLTDLEKRVFLALRQSFFNFSQLLCGLEVLLLQSQKLGVVSEQTMLGIEQLFVHLRDDTSERVGVPDVDGGLSNANGGLESADGARDSCVIHQGSPLVEKVRVRATDSTGGGDALAHPFPPQGP